MPLLGRLRPAPAPPTDPLDAARQAAIASLIREHAVIGVAVEALAGYADAVGRGMAAPGEDLAELVRFAEEFALRFHHGREEAVLVALMLEQGFVRERGPVAAMLEDHRRAADLLGVLAGLARAPRRTADQDRTLVESARALASLLRAHARAEEERHYPMALAHLSAERLDKVRHVFDAGALPADRLAADQARLRRLAGRYPRAGAGPDPQAATGAYGTR